MGADVDEEPVGWRVIDPDGNVVASGPPMELEMVADLGGTEEGADDGGDR
jgi:hypothetical protein